MVEPVDDDAPRGSEAILVVEDDELVRDLVVEVIAELGYRVLHALDGREALEIIRSDERIDLIFSDVALPGRITGIELVRAARQIRSDIKVLLTSGDRTHAAEAKEFHLIVKPYRRVELALRLREALASPVSIDR